jgi:hypothetical protein
VEAYDRLTASAAEFGIAKPQAIVDHFRGRSFLFKDPDGNCWEITGPR